MLKNDLSKKLMIRFKKSKDFNKTIEKLQKENYDIFKCGYIAENNNKYKMVVVGKDKKVLVKVIYEETKGEYKQNIYAIYY